MSTAYDPEDDGHLPSDYDDYDPHDDYDLYLDDPDSEARAEDPPEGYLEAEAERQLERHCDLVHGGGECDCPLPDWPEFPPCRRLNRIPRWSPRNSWQCGTKGGCVVWGYRSPRAAWRAHRQSHESPF